MEQSVFIPIINQDFEIYYFGKNKQSPTISNKYNESAEQLSQLDAWFALHSHDVYEILVCLNGSCEFFCEGKTYSIEAGDIVVVPPYAVHKATVQDFDRYERIIVAISPTLMEDFMTSNPDMKEHIIQQKTNGSYATYLDSTSFSEATTYLKKIVHKIQTGEDHFSFTLQYLLFQSLQRIYDPTSSKRNNQSYKKLDHRLASILEFIENHLTDPDLSLDNVADQFHLNKYYFSHYFKKHMNLSFYRYVTLKRLSIALNLIKQNEHSIETIALKCGFLDYSNFYRLFKKEFNRSPKNVQKEYRK